MTDAPAPPADPTVTPDSALAPAINLIMQLAPLWTTLAAQSGDVKTLATNLGVEAYLPWLGLAGTGVGIVVALRWCYLRALGRGRKWATWLQSAMPWNRVGAAGSD